MKANNSGDLALETQLVMNIHVPGDEYLIGWIEELSGFQPDQNRTFQYPLATSGLTPGAYQMTAYLVYDSRTSSVAQLQIQQLVKDHWPVVMR